MLNKRLLNSIPFDNLWHFIHQIESFWEFTKVCGWNVFTLSVVGLFDYNFNGFKAAMCNWIYMPPVEPPLYVCQCTGRSRVNMHLISFRYLSIVGRIAANANAMRHYIREWVVVVVLVVLNHMLDKWWLIGWYGGVY